MAKVLIVAEVKDGEVRKPTLELLTKARKESLEVEAVLVGVDVKPQADLLAGHGAGKVYVAEGASLQIFSAGPYAVAVADAVQQAAPDMVWFSVSEMSRALAPVVAAKLDAAFVGDVSSISLGDMTVTRPAMATKVVQKVRFTKEGLKVLTIRGGAFDAEDAAPGSASVVELSTPEADPRVTPKEILKEESGEIDLGDASMVVSVGRGAKDQEGVNTVKPLADMLGAAFGASRAVVDSGWMPHSAQVGQTGRVVTPDVYFAVGISGAIQHLAGMSGSKLIVAVNKDAEAPIFSVADYGIVGDLFKVVPLLTEELKKHKK